MRAVIAVLGLLLLTLAASAEEVELVSGERLVGRIAARSAEIIRLDHPILGMLAIPVAAVRTIDGKALRAAEPPQTKDRPAPDAAPVTAEPAAPAPEVEESEPEWTSQIELGLNARRATTDDLNLRVSFATTRTAPDHEFRYDALYRYATSRGNRSQNNFTTGLFSEWDAPSTRWNAFAQGRFDFDEFQSWDERLTVSGGVGYRLFDLKGTDESGKTIDRFKMTTRLGGGVRREFGSANDEFAPEGLLGAEFAYRMNGAMMLNGASTLFPDLQETGELRVVSRLDWTLDIDKLDGISLKLGLAHEYDSRAEPNVDPHDLSAYAALVIKF